MNNYETVKLYDIDSHIFKFEATVLDCRETENGYDVILDKTAFFPEGGGQAPDTGRIGENEVFDTQLSGKDIVHKTKAPIEIGRAYLCEIEAEKRFRRMQNHTGEHIVSGLVHRYFGYDNTGFHMGHDDVTLDFNGTFTEADIRRIEFLANKAVAENTAVSISYPTDEELKNLEYRSKLDLTEDVRIVTIEGYDVCACCAPHVKRTGEVGMIKLFDFVKNRDGTRIHMLCGFDALDDYNARHKLMSEIAQSFSTGQMQIGESIRHLEEEIAALKQKNYDLRSELLAYKTAALCETDGNICIFEEELSQNDMRKLMNEGLKKCGGVCAVFSGDDKKGYSFVASSNAGGMRNVISDMKTKFDIKGGGSDEMIQGSINVAADEIRKYFNV